jgi:hypothetical protein
MARVNVLSCKCEKVLLGVEVGYIGLGRVPSMPQCHDYVLRTFTKVLLSNCQLSRRLSHARTVRVTPIHLTTVTLRISNAIQPLHKGGIQGFFLHTILKQSQCRTFPYWRLKEHRSELVQCFALALDLQSRRRDF